MTLVLHHSGASPEAGSGALTWLSAVSPSSEERRRLQEEFGFDAELIDHALDPNERPRISRTKESKLTFVVLRVPWFEGPNAEVPYTTVPVGLILGGATNLVICARDAPMALELLRFAEQPAERGGFQRTLLRALELTAEAYLTSLDAIAEAVDKVEAQLQRSFENREVLQLLRYQKSLVFFTSALGAMHRMLERLDHIPSLRVSAEDEMWLEEVKVEFQQALDTSVMARDVLSETMDAFASIISNNLNFVMKFLATAAMVLAVPTMIASIYGMNVRLPGQDAPHTFWGIMLGSVLLSAIAAGYFRWRRWI